MHRLTCFVSTGEEDHGYSTMMQLRPHPGTTEDCKEAELFSRGHEAISLISPGLSLKSFELGASRCLKLVSLRHSPASWIATGCLKND